jgi:chromosome segregation ATPase
MSDLNKKWASITGKVHKVLEQQQALRDEVARLKLQVKEMQTERTALIKEKETLNNQINVLKLAKGVGLSDSERTAVKKQIKHYIGEIDECLAKMNM